MAQPTMALNSTASLIQNNLSSSSTGWLASLHASGGGKVQLTNGQAKFDGPEVNQPTSIRYLEPAAGPMLMISSTVGTQIYSQDAQTMYFHLTITAPEDNDERLKYHQGACLVPLDQATSLVVVGTSRGSLKLCEMQSDNFGSLRELPECVAGASLTEVADVCYVPLTNEVVSAHTNGTFVVWQQAAPGAFQATGTVAPSSPTYQAPIRVLPVANKILVAYGPGLFCFHDAVTKVLMAELTAHARWVTAVTASETGYVASVGEDTVLNVWLVDESPKINIVHTSVVCDKLLTGVAFSGPASCAVVAFDSEEIWSVPLG